MGAGDQAPETATGGGEPTSCFADLARLRSRPAGSGGSGGVAGEAGHMLRFGPRGPLLAVGSAYGLGAARAGEISIVRGRSKVIL